VEVHSVQEGGGCAVGDNGAERVMGMMQTRSRAVRGYKSDKDMSAALMLMLSGSGLSW